MKYLIIAVGGATETIHLRHGHVPWKNFKSVPSETVLSHPSTRAKFIMVWKTAKN